MWIQGGIMEKGTLIGLSVCVVGVFGSAVLHGINLVFLFTEVGSILIVFAGCIGATMISFPMEATSNASKYVQKVMKGDEHESAMETIGQIVKLTNRARSEGLLALEDEAKSIEDPFFRKGIEFAVDGTDPEALKKTLLSEIQAMKERHKIGQGWFTQAGVFAPTFGIIGAVFGLMATMAHLDAPAEVGHGIAGAFVATFWGVFLANALFLPMANKLKQLSTLEVAHKMLIVEGIMAIQAGVSPRVVEELLKSHVPPAERDEVPASAAEAPAPAEAEAEAA
jgi:chemotaxis protein MotA